MGSTEEYLDNLLASLSDENEILDLSKPDDILKSNMEIGDILDEMEKMEQEAPKGTTAKEISPLVSDFLGEDLQNEIDNVEFLDPEEIDLPDKEDIIAKKNKAKETASDSIEDLANELLEDLDIPDIDEALTEESESEDDDSAMEEKDSNSETSEIETVSSDEVTDKINLPDDIDSEMLLDLEDVDALLAEASKIDIEEESPSVQDEDDDIKEINDILNKSDSNEVMDDDLLSLLDDIDALPDVAEEALNEEDSSEEVEENKKGKKDKKKKDKKSKKNKSYDEDEPSESNDNPDSASETDPDLESLDDIPDKKSKKNKSEKKSLIDKIKDFMFDDEDEEEQVEEVKEKKSKDKKKDKKKKGKESGNKAQAGDPNAEIEKELEEEDKKNAKKKKDKKDKGKAPKKEKEKKAPTEEELKDKKKEISNKKIIMIMLVCFSLLGLILACSYFIPNYLSLEAARTAYYTSDYEEAAMRFYGKKLNASDELIYRKSSLLYDIELRTDKYYSLINMGEERKAVDALFTALKTCDEKKVEASTLSVTDELNVLRNQILAIMKDNYNLSEEEAEEICGMKKVYYSVAIDNLVQGRAYNEDANSVSEDETPQETEEEQPVLEDLLPEEAGIITE